MHLGAVYDVLYKFCNNVTPTFCFDGSAEHLHIGIVQNVRAKLLSLVFSEYQDLSEEKYCLQIRVIISYNNKGSNNPYFPLTSKFNFSVTI